MVCNRNIPQKWDIHMRKNNIGIPDSAHSLTFTIVPKVRKFSKNVSRLGTRDLTAARYAKSKHSHHSCFECKRSCLSTKNGFNGISFFQVWGGTMFDCGWRTNIGKASSGGGPPPRFTAFLAKSVNHVYLTSVEEATYRE